MNNKNYLLLFILNNSQKAGCIRLLPASHSCQPRNVQYRISAASVWLKFKLFLKTFICLGLGLAATLVPLLFGWLLKLTFFCNKTRKYYFVSYFPNISIIQTKFSIINKCCIKFICNFIRPFWNFAISAIKFYTIFFSHIFIIYSRTNFISNLTNIKLTIYFYYCTFFHFIFQSPCKPRRTCNKTFTACKPVYTHCVQLQALFALFLNFFTTFKTIRGNND